VKPERCKAEGSLKPGPRPPTTTSQSARSLEVNKEFLQVIRVAVLCGTREDTQGGKEVRKKGDEER